MTHHNVHIGSHFSVDGKPMAIAPTIGVGQYSNGLVGVTVTLLASDFTINTHDMSDQTNVVANRDLFGHEKLDEVVSFLKTHRATTWLRHLEETKDYPRTPSNETVDLIDELLDMLGETVNLDVPGKVDETQTTTWSGDTVPTKYTPAVFHELTRAHKAVLDMGEIAFIGDNSRGDNPLRVKYVTVDEVTTVDIAVVRQINRTFAADDAVNPVSITTGEVREYVTVTTLQGEYIVQVDEWAVANGVAASHQLPYPVTITGEQSYNDVHTFKTRDEVEKDNNKRNGVDT